MDAVDRRIIGALQDRFPISEFPFAEAAAAVDLPEGELIDRLGAMLDAGDLTRFGPLFDADRLGGAVTLAAMAVPPDRIEAVAGQVNAHLEVAHNYERGHALNMWFVIASEDPKRIGTVIAEIEAETGLTVLSMPKAREFFIGLRFEP